MSLFVVILFWPESANDEFILLTVQPDLDDNQKTWLIVGICLHNIITPVLRDYVKPVISTLFTSLKSSHGIDSQTYPNVLEKYPQPSGYALNYQAINNNIRFGKLTKNKRSYDYRVGSELELSKIFLQTHMTHYTGFNETCDASALYGIILNCGQFQPLVSTVVERVSVISPH